MNHPNMRSDLLSAALALAALLPAIALAETAERKASEPLKLAPMQITGSREQPRVMNIVPWKRPPSALPPGAPADSVLDEATQPVNRVEFRRELRYYEGLQPDAAP
ncbi:MAG: hypothetical protein QM661_15975 [Solimonas sp.]